MKCYYMCAKRKEGKGGLKISTARQNDPSTLFNFFHLSVPTHSSLVLHPLMSFSVADMYNPIVLFAMDGAAILMKTQSALITLEKIRVLMDFEFPFKTKVFKFFIRCQIKLFLNLFFPSYQKKRKLFFL